MGRKKQVTEEKKKEKKIKEMKTRQSRPGFELSSPIPFSTKQPAVTLVLKSK